MNTDNDVLFNEALRKARKALKLSQTELAVRSGISLMSVRRYETGESFPDMKKFTKLNTVLKNGDLVSTWVRLFCKTNNADAPADTLLKEISDNIHNAFFSNLIENGNKEFIDYIYSLTNILMTMNGKGITEVINFSELMALVPEHKANRIWAYQELNPENQ